MKKLIAVIVVFAAAAPAALASSGSLSVTHSAVNPGSKVKVSGAASGCRCPVTLASLAFASKHKSGSVPSITPRSVAASSPSKAKLKGTDAGKYKISAGCKGSKFASAKLKVKGSPGGGFYCRQPSAGHPRSSSYAPRRGVRGAPRLP